MPATEKTWYDQIRLHVIFGITSIVMLAATIWLVWKDHNDEWKRWQLADRKRVAWTLNAQLAQAQADTKSRLQKLNADLLAARSTTIDSALLKRFQQLVENEDKRLAGLGQAVSPANFTALHGVMAQLEASSPGTSAAASARENVLGALGSFTREARRRENALVTKKKFAAADQTAAVSARGIAVGEGKSTVEIEKQIESLAAQIAQLDADVAAAKDYRTALESIVADIKSGESEIEKQIAEISANINRLEGNIGANTTNVGEWVTRAPVLDALYSGTIKLDQIWLPDMKINYNFSQVARYDRCINCHRAIDKTLPGSAVEPAYPAIPRAERVRELQLATPELEQTLVALFGVSLEAPDANDPAKVVVADVQEDGFASSAGLQKGDILLEVGDESIGSMAQVESYLVEPNNWGATQPLRIQRGDAQLSLDLKTPTVESVYGIRLAEYGQVEPDAVTIQVVFPESLAAVAGFQMGDIIRAISDGKVESAADVDHYLLQVVNWGEKIPVRIERGLNQPFTSHPRLDLFVGSVSPHKKGEMGCTICHDGQGSATEFKWASHTPNDPEQALDWSRRHGWFDNHHWIFPMLPARFIESNCLKCHHEVVDLQPSERFPEPPAPKLVQGYELVREYGCYGCHEINGFDGPTKRIGPDLRNEPNYSAVAAQILQDQGLSDDERAWATNLVARPDDREVREQLALAIRQDAQLADSDDTAGDVRLAKSTHTLADLLKDIDAPGTLRKVGPSLRHLDSKVDFEWLYSWIRKPSDFRPTTRMPQFFGHVNHLSTEGEDFVIVDAEGNVQKMSDREYTERFEAIEIRALSEFLLSNSQTFAYADAPKNVTEMPSAERGRWAFESRGCLACHSHEAFPGIASTHGPDLSRVSAKFGTPKGQRWLYSWLKQPNRYHARTVMPNLFLDPITQTDPAGNPTGKVTDPAADITAFLLGEPANWQPQNVPARNELTADEAAALNQLTTVWLSASFPRRRAEDYAKNGIPERLAATVKVDEQTLIGMTPENRTQKQLTYVARRSLSRYGCFGCHDIPGYEGDKPIGTPLANWGRKESAQLAFENVGTFLAMHGINGDQTPDAHGGHDAGGHGLDPRAFDPDTGFFVQSLNSHQRQGFLWQKLRMPRAFDFETTRNKRYDERLRMPKFRFNAQELEAVMTFVLGLTSEAPDQRYIYKPDARQEAIVQGRHVLDKYNCAGCHILDMERWDIAFSPDRFEEPPTTADFPFLAPKVTEAELQASLKPDRRGLLHAQIHGMPTRNPETGELNLVDEDGVPIEPDDTESEPFFEFQLYDHAVVSGAARLVGVQNLLIPAARDASGPLQGQAFPARGGDLTRYLFPRVIAEEHKTNPSAIPNEAWGWLPPPLHNEGEKVQTEWLHDFLMDPTAIRPAVVMRMPNFHMSADEARKLVNYFAAKRNATFPYEYNERRRDDYLAASEAAHPGLFDDAMKIVTDANYCVKCHSVGDFQVKGAIRTLGPNLDEVYRRLRPDYVRRWIASPQRILPYTGMPVNIPYAPEGPHFGGVNQQLFPGTSEAQLDGLVDLLMNFDEFAKRKTSVKSLVKEPPPAEPPSAESAEAGEPRDDQSARN